jgi:hypothetical protein
MALDYATAAIAAGGFFSGGYAAWQSRKAQAISVNADEKAQEWTTMRDTVKLLQDERDGLREHLEGIETRHLRETDAILARNREAIADLSDRLEAERRHSAELEAEVRRMRVELTAFWEANERRRSGSDFPGPDRRSEAPPPATPESA